MAARIAQKRRKVQAIGPVRANAAIQAEYYRRLDVLLAELTHSVEYWVRASYRANEPATMAQDRSAADILNALMKRLARRWMRRFTIEAPKLAGWFAKSASDRSDASLKAQLKKAGFTVRFQTTPAQQDAVQAVLAENVNLIKSIAQQHLDQVQQAVMRSVATGRDLHALSEELQRIGGVSKRRAALIARDQSNKSNAVIVKTRQAELGVTHATWQHSHGGKHPRPEHVRANGKTYEIAKGMYLDGKWTWPGVEINCRCVSRSIVPGLERT